MKPAWTQSKGEDWRLKEEDKSRKTKGTSRSQGGSNIMLEGTCCIRQQEHREATAGKSIMSNSKSIMSDNNNGKRREEQESKMEREDKNKARPEVKVHTY
jgi:hypothetical protein